MKARARMRARQERRSALSRPVPVYRFARRARHAASPHDAACRARLRRRPWPGALDRGLFLRRRVVAARIANWESDSRRPLCRNRFRELLWGSLPLWSGRGGRSLLAAETSAPACAWPSPPTRRVVDSNVARTPLRLRLPVEKSSKLFYCSATPLLQRLLRLLWRDDVNRIPVVLRRAEPVEHDVKGVRHVLDGALQPHLTVEGEEEIVALACDAQGRILDLGGELAIVQALAPAVNHRPCLERALARPQPLDAITPGAVKQYGDDGIAERHARRARLWKRGADVRDGAFDDKPVPRKSRLAAHACARAAHAAHPKLAVFQLELTAAAALESEALPLGLVKLLAVEVVAPLLDGDRRRLRRLASGGRGRWHRGRGRLLRDRSGRRQADHQKGEKWAREIHEL